MALRLFGLATIALTQLGGGLLATEIALPKQVAWTAYDTGSTGYNQSVAIGSALKGELGVDLRVLPGKNDVARTVPLREGKVHFSATGIGGSFMAQEGAFVFGTKEWGPQPIRVLLANNSGDFNIALGVAGDAGIGEYNDLKGKRVAWVKGAPALNVNTTAYLAYGNLTWDDVEKVEFGGFGDSWKGMINGQVDAVFGTTNSGMAYQMGASPRGLIWPPVHHDDADGIARMQKIAPFFTPNMATVGASIDGGAPHEGMGYAYPVLIAMADQDEDLVYNMTKAMAELFERYEGAAPGIGGWAIGKQDFGWVAPFHDGAIRYFQEIGIWNDEAQANNDKLLARQTALAGAWDALAAKGVDDEGWETAWREVRRAALEAGGFEIVF